MTEKELEDTCTQLEQHIMPIMNFYDDFPKKGIKFLDIFSATEKPEAFKKIIDALKLMIEVKVGKPGVAFTHLAGLESKGFVLGPILAYMWNISFIPIRKKGKLPGECIKQDYTLEYGSDTIEIQTTAFKAGDKVVLIDDLLATGGTLWAAESLLKRCEGVEVVANALIFEIDVLKGRERLTAPQTLTLIHLK